MSPERAIELIDIFDAIEISKTDVTSSEEKEQGRIALLVNMLFQGKNYKTKKLFYKDVKLDSPRVQNPEELEQYFGERVYWLDIDTHPWPQGKGESDLEGIVISDMAENNNTPFITFLRSLANNAQTGWIQEFTKDGQRGQYYHNLLNNNHWHDIILLIKAFIKSKGQSIDEKYFNPLVFQWSGQEGDKKRTSLSKAFGDRRMIDLLQENIKSAFKLLNTMKQFDAIIKLINYKPQIILQGPPGTGKTRLAREIAEELCRQSQSIKIDKSFVLDHLYVGLELPTPKDGIKFKIVEIKDSVKIKLSTESEYVISFSSIIKTVNGEEINENPDGSYLPAIARYLRSRYSQDQIKMIQFHPSYSYEDFVRGIASEVRDGEIEYVAVNKILAEFAKTANDNLKDSQKDILVLSREKWAESMLKEYADHVEERLVADSKYKIGDSVAYIFEVEEDAFRYKGDKWEKHERGLRMKFHQLLDVYLKGAESRRDIKKIPNIKGLVNQHATYYSKVLQDFKKFLTGKPPYSSGAVNISRKNYVLIIDEINRANLSSVLGELIYALEYRDKPVESIYEVDGERELVLPSNLYIIGTMNTADRSVGHIDYAIRRRFGFVTIPADESVVVSNGSVEALNLFKKVYSLFYSTKDEQGNIKPSFLSSEFRAEDVMLGHSYFLEKDSDRLRVRFEYEITPILKEYVKDGILSDSALKEMETW